MTGSASPAPKATFLLGGYVAKPLPGTPANLAALERAVGPLTLETTYQSMTKPFHHAPTTRTLDVSLTYGGTDTDAIARAHEFATFGAVMFVRFGWEPNLASKHLAPSTYITWFRHIAPLVKAIAPNVRATFCTANTAHQAISYYPGDDVTDATCFDAYDRAGKGLYATADAPYAMLKRFHKPMLWGEFGTRSWATFAPQCATVHLRYPLLVGMGLFDAPGGQKWNLAPADVPLVASCFSALAT